MTASHRLSGMKLLIVDDEQANIALLQYILTAAGYTQLRCVADSRQVMAAFQEFQPDLILLDLMMPFVSGFEIMEQLRRVIPPDDVLPILVLTADVNTESKHQALLAGASDFLTKPFDQVEALLRIRHLLQLRLQHQQLARQNDVLEDTVRERTGELRQTLSQLQETLSQLRSTQQQVIQHERLSALGSMAAGLAHDFNNSLSLILGYSELLLAELVDTRTRAGPTSSSARSSRRRRTRRGCSGGCGSIFRQVDHDQEWRAVDLNVLVEQAVALTRPRWHGQALGQGVTIRLRTDLCAGLPALLADAAELREMLTNLIFNAVDALPRGGEITLRTRAEEAAVALEVADTGTGMDEETRRRCLEPFFTTKGQQGTGLGLAMVYGTMQRHGGRIELHSTPGHGTTFTFLLPLQPPLAVADAPAEPPAPEAQRPWRILVVDDQPIFVNILRHYLAHDLHSVETAHDGHEALERVRARTFDLVITDRAMPHMHGDELAAEVKRLSPRTRVILLTGYSGEEPHALSPSLDAVVLKPVTHAALRAIIGRTMTGYEPAAPVKRVSKPRRPTNANTLRKLGLRRQSGV